MRDTIENTFIPQFKIDADVLRGETERSTKKHCLSIENNSMTRVISGRNDAINFHISLAAKLFDWNLGENQQ